MESILRSVPTFLSLGETGFAYGFQGALLRRHLEKYWYQKCVTKSIYDIFYLPSKRINENISELKEIALNDLSRGFAEFDCVKNTWNEEIAPWKNIQQKIASVSVFHDDSNNLKDLFYTKQRERKSWWRKISQNPSIYSLSPMKKEKGSECVELEAQFEFGNIVIEKIYLKKKNEKSANSSIIQHITSLDWGCLTLICDGLKNSKELQLYPQLAPYKVLIKTNCEVCSEDLRNLVSYLRNLLREKNIETLFAQNQETSKVFQVPFLVTIDENTLKTGMLKLTSQRTSVDEPIHITHLINRISSHCF